MEEEENKTKTKEVKKVRDVYFTKTGAVRYLTSKNNKKGCCQTCGKKRKTTAHHLIPKRLKCICPILAEVRIRVCDECDKDFHPENKLLRESEIVGRQNNNINNLKDAVYWRSMKINKAVQTLSRVKKSVEDFLAVNDETYYRKGAKIQLKKDERGLWKKW